MNMRQPLDSLYDYLANEEDARVCRDISDTACTAVPRNFFLIIVANTLSKLGDALSNPKTVLAWLLEYLHAPLYLIGLLVPIRESGSLIPQLAIASYIRHLAIRKWAWIGGSIIQAASIMATGLVALHLQGATAGWAVIGLLVFFSLGRGICSVAFKDVLGKTIPKTRRGLLSGYSASLAGYLGMAIGLAFLVFGHEAAGGPFYGWLLLCTGASWLVAAAVYAAVEEEPGETGGGGNALAEALQRMGLLAADRDFRRFVITRALLLCSALTAPYYVVLAQDTHAGELFLLGLFILANGLASSISAPVWGRLSDRSSKSVMIMAALMTAALGIATFIIASWIPGLHENRWTYPLLFMLLGIAHSGVRLGRKTYIVDLAGGNRRTDYVAVSNTVIGVVLLVMGGVGAAASGTSAAGVILLFSILGLLGAVIGRGLPEVE
ncbi:MAG: MFS transporter [Gammaproteobacteria bacterium]|nr:MFS transporter [Gammaproteobacteria bacterium]